MNALFQEDYARIEKRVTSRYLGSKISGAFSRQRRSFALSNDGR